MLLIENDQKVEGITSFCEKISISRNYMDKNLVCSTSQRRNFRFLSKEEKNEAQTETYDSSFFLSFVCLREAFISPKQGRTQRGRGVDPPPRNV
jgi:hypothetical protein